MPEIIVPKKVRLLEKPGYEAFMDALQEAYNLHRLSPENVKWASIDMALADVGSPPSVVLSISKNRPQLAVALYPTIEGNVVTESDIYHAPLLFRDVQLWKDASKSLGNYQLVSWLGRPESESMFSQPRSLNEVLNKLELSQALTDETIVVEAIALLPIAPNGEFKTEFNPHIRYEAGHKHYRITVISQESISVYSLLTQGQRTDVKRIDESQKMFNWDAQFVPDLSDFEQLMLPTNRGHMILIATPYKPEGPKYGQWDFGREFGFGGGGLMKGGGPLSFGSGLTRGASVGDVNIGRGSQSGQGSLFEGPITDSKEGSPIIYHLRVLGVKPETAKNLDAEKIGRLGAILNNYSKN